MLLLSAKHLNHAVRLPQGIIHFHAIVHSGCLISDRLYRCISRLKHLYSLLGRWSSSIAPTTPRCVFPRRRCHRRRRRSLEQVVAGRLSADLSLISADGLHARIVRLLHRRGRVRRRATI